MNLNLKRKIIGITISILLIMTIVFGYFLKTAVYESLEEEIDRRAYAIGKHFTELAADAELSGSTSLLQTHLADYIKTESYLAYIIVFDPNGEIQAHTFPAAVPPEILKSVKSNNSPKTVHFYSAADGAKLQDFFIKSGISSVGGVHIGIYESNISNSIYRLILKLIPFLLAVILSGILLAYLLASAIVRPLEELTKGVKRVTHGDLNFMIDIQTRDEIEQLANAFNQMTGNLLESTVSREFMEKLIDTMNEVLVVISTDGVIMNFNRAYSELFGSVLSEVVGRHVTEFDDAEAPARMFASYLASLENGEVQGIETLCRLPSGELIPLLLSLAVMHDEDGEPQALIFAAQNISSLKDIQDALQQKQTELEEVNRNLEVIVASRTAELAIGNEGLRAEVAERQKKTEELRAARDLAESANRSKSEFLANMSHEMRTPLNSIIGGAEYLDSTAAGEDQHRCLSMIRHAGDSLLVLINDLIDLSRIEAGQLEIISRLFSLWLTLEQVLEMISQAGEQKKLTLSLNGLHSIPNLVNGDQIRLQQVLVNLLTNAVKFTEPGGTVSVTVSAQSAIDNQVPVTFIIKDTGIGIDPDKLDMIFESFSQADTSITRRFGGSGLGLAISRKLVEAMGGKMQVESLPSVGSSFSFTILFSNASSVTEQLSAPVNDNVMPQTKTAEERLTDEPKRLLIVDDSVENRELMRLLLRTYSLQIDEAGNGQEAVDLSAGICYDLVFMDIQMPVMDGYTATRMIRRIEERSGRNRTKIIALTAHAYESDIQKCLEAGCDGHVAKPFKKKTLLDCLANNL